MNESKEDRIKEDRYKRTIKHTREKGFVCILTSHLQWYAYIKTANSSSGNTLFL
jgi:hypothetical protein